MGFNYPLLDSSYGGFGGGGGGYGGYPFPMMMQPPPEPEPGSLEARLKSIGGLIGFGGAANYNLRGQNLGPMKDIASQIASLGRAQYDTGDPLYQRTYEDERGAGMQDLAAAIAEMARQNRKLSSMGRTPLFNPERGGEMAFRGMTQGYQNVQEQARARARQILAGGQSALGNTFSAYGTLAGAQDMNKKKKAFGFGNIGDALPLLGKLF